MTFLKFWHNFKSFSNSPLTSPLLSMVVAVVVEGGGIFRPGVAKRMFYILRVHQPAEIKCMI